MPQSLLILKSRSKQFVDVLVSERNFAASWELVMVDAAAAAEAYVTRSCGRPGEQACGFRGDRAHHSEEFPPGIPI
jgi:hypothetical protein